MAEPTNGRNGDSSERRVMGDWASAAMLVGFAFALVFFLLGVFFLIDVLVKGWPR